MWRDVVPPKAVVVEAVACTGVAEVTLEDLALWVFRALEASAEAGTNTAPWHPEAPSWPAPAASRPPKMGEVPQVPHVPHHPATLLQGSPSGAVATWLRRKQEASTTPQPDPEYVPPLAWKRRVFGGRSFLLWVEDAGEHNAAVVYACDEGTGACGNLELPDDVLRPSFWHFVQGSTSGLLSELQLSPASDGRLHSLQSIQKPCSPRSPQKPRRMDEHPRHRRLRPDRSATQSGRKAAICSCDDEPLGPILSVNHEHLVDDFLLSLLDAVYFEANAFGDEWSIRLPGLGPRSRAETLGEGFGPAIGLATSPGARPTRWPKWLNEEESQIIKRQSIRQIGHPALVSRPWRRTQVVDDSSGRPYGISSAADSDASTWSPSASPGTPLATRLRRIRDGEEGRLNAAATQDCEEFSPCAYRCEDHTDGHVADLDDDGGTGATKDHMLQPTWIPPLHFEECFSNAGYLNNAHADGPSIVQGAPGGHPRTKLRARSAGARRPLLPGRRTSMGSHADNCCAASCSGTGLENSPDARPVAGTGGVDSLHASLVSPPGSLGESCGQHPRACSPTVRPGIRYMDGETAPLHPHDRPEGCVMERRTLKGRLRFLQELASGQVYPGCGLPTQSATAAYGCAGKMPASCRAEFET
mmetsp:Transcript_124404/g.202279  ORF Transcript_124404/g.202279 Transcript_124404/m.202279 type:complete len:642 (+) Transcript_124404:99-2024(+)